MENLTDNTARNLVNLMKTNQITVQKVMEQHLNKINELNPKLNALVNVDFESALKRAKELDELPVDKKRGALFGLPIAIKDIHHVKGFPTTYGCTGLKDNYTNQDEIAVERLKAEGAIIIGKTNVPEFASGAHTFNDLFGLTKNPYDLSKTAGGSSGGAAVGVATGMLPLADGTDMGGSLRYPASYNNIVGLRPSAGLVPDLKQAMYSPLQVQGPMARNVDDLLLMLSVVAGETTRSPLSIKTSGKEFNYPLDMDIKGFKIAYSVDFNGNISVEDEVREGLSHQVDVLKNLGCEVVEDCPDFSHVDEAFQTLRAFEMEMTWSDIFDKHEKDMKPSLVWNINKGKGLKGVDIGRAEKIRHTLFHEMDRFFNKYDAFVLPVSQVVPFDGKYEYPQEINGKKVENYVDWMKSCYYITATGCPALSVPGGFTKDGLPLGLQIVTAFRKDLKALRIGKAFEFTTNYSDIRPTFKESVDSDI